LFELFVRAGRRPLAPADQQLFETMASFSPVCISMAEVMAALPGCDRQALAEQVYKGIDQGWILPRIESVHFEVEPPEFPALNALRRECARRSWPLVDIWHQPCSFPARHYAVLEAMDGSRDQASLDAFAKCHCPELAFEPWLKHLAGRGLFA
jgi:hypothetical protein